MQEIFRIQLGQILGGKMKWLMAICLTLPVLLTFAVVSAGALNEIEGEQVWQRLLTGIMPNSSHRVDWQGEDLHFLDDRLVLKKDGPFLDGRRFSEDGLMMVNWGYLIIEDGQLWIDESKRSNSNNTNIRSVTHWSKGEQTWQQLMSGIIPNGSHRVDWQGEDLHFLGDQIALKRSGPFLAGRHFSEDGLMMANFGYLIIMNGRLWIDESKRSNSNNTNIQSIQHWSIDSEPGDTIVLTLKTISAIYLFLLYPQAICLLLALFYGTSVLTQELGGQTLSYLFTRPLPRWKFVVGKYLGILSALSLPTGISLFASWMIFGAAGSAALFSSLLLATILALATYNAIFILFGFLIPRRAMIAALLYGILFELILSFMPALVNQFTVTYYLRSIVVGSLDLEVPREISRIVGGASIPIALFAVAAIIASTLGIASLLAARKEYVVNDQA